MKRPRSAARVPVAEAACVGAAAVVEKMVVLLSIGSSTLLSPLILLLFLTSSFVTAALDSKTLQCSPKIFVPFTFSGVTRTFIARGTQSTGFSHMAAAWLAMEHFNRRDTSIVPELGEDIFQECNATFDLERNETAFINTDSTGHQATQLLYQRSQGGRDQLPCAFIGPYHDATAMNVATLASSLWVPHIPFGGQDARLSENLLLPFTTTLYPRIADITVALGRFLTLHTRTNYIAVLFAYSEVGNQFQEGISIALDALGVTQKKYFGYLSATIPVPIRQQELRDAIYRIKESGYRTIVVTMDNDVFDLPEIADLAEEVGMNTVEYFWIFLPPYQHESVQGLIDLPASMRKFLDPPVPNYDNVRKLLTGAALLQPVDGFQVDPEDDKLAKAWRSVDEAFVERLSSKATVISLHGEYEAGDFESTSIEYFRTEVPEPGSSYIFDAVMSVGMGNCLAERQLRSSNGKRSEGEESIISGQTQLEGIRMTNFSGASGHVEFGESFGLLGTVNGARRPKHMSIGVFNLFPPMSEVDGSQGTDKSFVLTATFTELTDAEGIKAFQDGRIDADNLLSVDEYHPFIFRDGTSTAPELLRDPADQNYLSAALRYVGISMMSITLACCFAFGAWVFVHRNRRIVKAAQPEFLYLLIFGAALSSLSIFFVSTDENFGYTAEQLGRHCMSIVWLFSIGHIVTYSALFTKLWRLNKVLQFSRRQITVSAVAWPAALLMLAALTILTLWTIAAPLTWHRIILDDETGESIGQCDSESMGYFIIALATVLIIPSVLVCIMAWNTRDVDDIYSESSWIFTLVVIQLQVIMIGIPLVVVLRDVSTDGKYIGLLVLLWFMPMSTILLILLPKIVAHQKGMQGMTFSERARGSSAGVRVTGMPESLAESARRTSGEDSRRTTNTRSRLSSELNNKAQPCESQSEAQSAEVDEFAEESTVPSLGAGG